MIETIGLSGLSRNSLSPELIRIADKVYNQERISNEDALILFETNNLGFLGELAHSIRIRKHGLNTYFNRNFHIEPTNICIYSCSFCALFCVLADEHFELSIHL